MTSSQEIEWVHPLNPAARCMGPGAHIGQTIKDLKAVPCNKNYWLWANTVFLNVITPFIKASNNVLQYLYATSSTTYVLKNFYIGAHLQSRP